MSVGRKSPFIEAIFERSSSLVDIVSTLNIRLCKTPSQSYLTLSPDSSSGFVSIESLSLVVKANIVMIGLLDTV